MAASKASELAPCSQQQLEAFGRARKALLAGGNHACGWIVSHLDVTCDGCECEPITGLRYTCQPCAGGEDGGFDLCGDCVRNVSHRHRLVLYEGPARAVTLTLTAGEAPPVTQQRLLQFRELFSPSQTCTADLAWICVSFEPGMHAAELRPCPKEQTLPLSECGSKMQETAGDELSDPSLDEDDIEDLVYQALSEWSTLCQERTERNQPITVDDVHDIASRCQLLVGKWMLFVPTRNADLVWQALTDEFSKGTLGSSMKISPVAVDPTKSPIPAKDSHAVCVYTANYQDLDTVNQIRDRIIALNLPGVRRLLYKPDIFTYLGIYAGNPWNIKPTIYEHTIVL